MMEIRTVSQVGGLLLALGWCGQALADTSDPWAVIEQARQLQAQGQGEQARDLLLEALQHSPDNETLVLARAESYLADDNEFWALKVLGEFEEAHPPACQARMFMARIHIDEANMEQAKELLDRPGCDQPEPMRARKLVLRAVIAQAREDSAAAKALVQEAEQTSERYEEDAALLQSLGAQYDPYRMPLLSWKIDLGAGWTSNGLAGSPVDQAAPDQDTQSAILVLDAGLRLVVPTAVPVRPTAEVNFRLSELLSDAARDLSTRQPTLRAGAQLGEGHPHVTLNYAYDVVQVQQGDQYDDGPVLYSEAHRGEYELEATDSVIAFGGAGQRRFREAGRTRLEFEQGLAMALGLSDSVRLMTGLSARFYQARNEAYDAVGATGLARLSTSFPGGFELRETISLSGDLYPASEGAFSGSGNRDRSETLLRVGAGLWSPSTKGFRVGLDYEYTNRDSTAEAYSFTDHRTLLHLAYNYGSDRLSVNRIGTQGRVPLQHGVEAAEEEGESEMKIRDLMRRDEAVQRGSSCLK
jgi:tetratricopeptide (TPR) repeat protein